MNPQQAIVPNFTFVQDFSFDFTKVTKLNILPDNQCFVLHNLFTQNECVQLIEQGEKYGFLDLNNQYSQQYRNNQRIININENLKSIMFERISKYIDSMIKIDCGKHPTIATTFYTGGIWQIDDLNNTFRLCKYNPTNFFKRHCDEGYHPNPIDHRSLKTCMLYLNENFEGGETVFYLDNLKEMFDLDRTTVSIKPKMGMCLIFNQNIFHEGLTVASGLKYFIRTDILYKKIESYVDSTLNETQLKALELYEVGVEHERSNEHEKAISMYKRAHKLYDKVEELYGSLYF